jgi:RimJ/RimL family protein N-acetyltransferase
MITEENFIDCSCPHCGAAASFPESYAGLVQACPNCMDDLIPPKVTGSPAGKLPLPLATPRLVLRRLAGGDWKGLMESLPGDDEDRITRWLERDQQVKLTTPDQTFCVAIELCESGRFVGYIGLRLTGARQAAVNFVMHPQYEQTDLPAEALDALLGFCFEGIRLHRVTSALVDTDAPGIKLCEAVGMRREAMFIKDTENPEGGWWTSIWYGVLEEEYQDNPPS